MFVPLAIGRDDRVGNLVPLQRRFGRRDVVAHGFAAGFAVIDPAVPAATDDIPVPFAVGVVGRGRLALGVEMLVVLDVLAVLLLGRGDTELFKVFLALFQVVVGVLPLDDPLEPSDITVSSA